MLSVVKLLLKGEVGVCALSSPGNYIVDHRKIMELFLNFYGNPVEKSFLFDFRQTVTPGYVPLTLSRSGQSSHMEMSL